MRILILTEAGDGSAYAVATALQLKGAEVILWHTSDFPVHSTETALFENGVLSIHRGGPEETLALTNFDVVWRRRPSANLDMSKLHPADRKFAEAECQVFRRSLFSILCRQAFWVNQPEAAISAGSKLVQHQAALDVGLLVPDTLYTNDPLEIRQFIRRNGGTIIYKTFRPTSWQDEETSWAPYTSSLREDQLVDDEILIRTPGIYQALINKAYELRVTVMGYRALAAKIHSQDTTSGRLDWRKSYAELRMEPYQRPTHIIEQCSSLLEKLGLVFGCFDFVVTPSGDYVFLEVNEMGQFLFVEDYTGMPLLDAFTEFLLQGKDFVWDERKASIHHSDLRKVVEEMTLRACQAHPPLPEHTIWEGRTKRTKSDPGKAKRA